MRNRSRHQLQKFQRAYFATPAGPKCKQCVFEEKRAKDPSLVPQKKNHYEFCPKSRVYKDRVKELRGLLQQEPTLEAGSEEFKASAAAIKHLQVKLSLPYNTAKDQESLCCIVGKGPTLKKAKPVRKKIVKAPSSHQIYKNLVDQREFATHSGTAKSVKVFFMPKTQGGGAGAARNIQKLYRKDYKEKNQPCKQQQEAAKAEQEA